MNKKFNLVVYKEGYKTIIHKCGCCKDKMECTAKKYRKVGYCYTMERLYNQ